MKNVMLAIKGFFIGIANIIPGVSGGTLMITLGIYEDVINAISHFLRDFKKNIKFLFFLGIGVIVSIVLMSNVITYTLEFYQLPTIIFFIGLILGGVPMLFKKVKGHTKSVSNILIFALMFSLVAALPFLGEGTSMVSFENMGVFSYFLLFLVGIVAAASMVIPGISGSFLLILLGYYEPVLDTIKSLFTFDNIIGDGIVLGVFGLGILFGIVLVAKLIEFLLKKFEVKTFCGILGFVLASVISIFAEALKGGGLEFSAIQIGIAVPLFIGGMIISYKIGD